GAPGEFAYQPVKVGVRGGVVYVESHRDIYGYAPALYREATALIERARLGGRGDPKMLGDALDDTGGLPMRLTPGPGGVPLLRVRAGRVGESSRGRAPDPHDGEAGDD